MQINEDNIYVEYLKKSDIVGFDALFHKYSKSLYAFTLSITRDSFAAEELTQLVFMKVWEKRALINEHLSFKSFLFSIAYNETISWLRKEKSEKRRINEFAQKSGTITNETELTVEFRNIEGLANQLIEEMPEKRKEIFKLSRINGFSNKEIAEKLGISVRTVENQISSALRYLREKLEKHQILGLLFFFIMFHQ
ncbi:RNA polymerase sigma factor [Maribellus maritimus]|uniref:RNA polymerase sigma factor n=1 Tax=Maribellus maritimus TaxID=2870838 RepID=UPI001EEA74F0|nr:RNA polymerase sigma-70 factor [Maribellus maritimus]MCG6190831.1 RNA polymerase sigma-70 factor [Maribellus maritimus]